MPVVALASAKHSPGVTTTALALCRAWTAPKDTLLIELDPAGGDLAHRQELRLEPGLVSLAAEGRHDLNVDHVVMHTQTTCGDVRVVTAPPSAETARFVVGNIGGRLVEVMRSTPSVTTFVDCGRVDADSKSIPALLAADLIVMVCRPTVEGVDHLKACLKDLVLDQDPRLRVLVVGTKPYSASEISTFLGIPVLAAVENDERGVLGLRPHSGLAQLRTSTFMRSVRSLARIIAGEIEMLSMPGLIDLARVVS